MACKKKIKGSSFGYKFIFFSFLFLGFIFFILTLGGSSYLSSTIPDYANITSFNATVELNIFNFPTGIIIPNIGGYFNEITAILFNPFSAITWLSWFMIAIIITDLYIIITSLIP